MRLATPGAALAMGILIVVMLVLLAVIGSTAHQFTLSGLGQLGLHLSFDAVFGIRVWTAIRTVTEPRSAATASPPG
jgi:hypothetical protein